ncbi:MAG: hypothetical protein ABEH77_06725 [Halobacteriaceae archaeon]
MDDGEQMRFGADGLEPAADEETDFGEPLGEDETKGGYNRYDVSSLLQKAVRRSDEEVAAWAAWELQRSGYGWNLWDRLALYVAEDLAAGEEAGLLVARHHDSLDDETDTGWEARLLAIHAALTAARARSSREATYADEYFRRVARERAAAREEGREPRERFPVPEDELAVGGRFGVALDQHTGPGAAAGRGAEHFAVHGARVGPEGEPPLAAAWRERALELSELELSERQVRHALAPVEETDPWWEPDL